MSTWKRRQRRAKLRKLKPVDGDETEAVRDTVVQSESYYTTLARNLAKLNSCSPEDVRERALMAGLELEAYRTYTAIADRACPHCHGRNSSRSPQEVARFDGKAKTAWSTINEWVNLSTVEFTDQRAEVSAGKAPAVSVVVR